MAAGQEHRLTNLGIRFGQPHERERSGLAGETSWPRRAEADGKPVACTGVHEVLERPECVAPIGSQFSLLALPLTAVLVLHASPGQMGLLGASLAAPGLFFGLVAGVWLDRTRRRPSW